MSEHLTIRDRQALLDAANRPGGWGLFMRKTTEKLALKGYFEKVQHPSYGPQFRITDAGRAVVTAGQSGAS